MLEDSSKFHFFDCGGKRLDLSTPKVMGILNISPDSFYDGGRYATPEEQLGKAERMASEGAVIIDIGAVSTRPGAPEVSEEEELKRLLPVIDRVSKAIPGTILSVDTFRPSVARAAVDHGAGMINDIYGGRFHPSMIETVVSLEVPYVLMHMQGTPQTMQDNPEYKDAVKEVSDFFSRQLALFPHGYRQIILDPGFGFGKTADHNFRLLAKLDHFQSFHLPLLAGLSRKSMICKTLSVKPADALNGTTVLHTIALLKGVSILRVHDVRQAMEAIRLVGMMNE